MKYSLKTYLFEDVDTDLLTGEWIDVSLADLPEKNLQRLWDNYSTCYTTVSYTHLTLPTTPYV